MKKKLPVILGLISMLALSLPALQQGFRFMSVRGLDGAIERDTTRYSFSWWDRGFQKHLERYSTDSLSLRPACVRARNQFEFTFFDKLNAQDVYEYDGIFYRMYHRYFSEQTNFIGKERVKSDVNSLKHFQESLRSKNIPIYVVIGPSKMQLYEKQLPWWNLTKTDQTNYIQYKKALLKAGINVLDANAWFKDLQHHSKAALISRYGVHWSLYGAVITYDSLIRRINHDKGTDFQRPEFEFAKVGDVHREDLDVVNISNLMFPPKDATLRDLRFPEIHNRRKRLRVCMIADSFFGLIAWSGVNQQVTDDGSTYYYYFNSRYGFRPTPADESVNEKVVDEDLYTSDCVVIMTDIINMENFGFGFIQKYLQQQKGF